MSVSSVGTYVRGCQRTGPTSRNAAYCSCGMPLRYNAGSRRSMSTASGCGFTRSDARQLHSIRQSRPAKGSQPVRANELLDIELIKQLKGRYCRTMDTKDWDGMRRVFTDDVEMDTTESGGGLMVGADD